MLRILAGTLISGVLISGPAAASSFLVIEHSGEISLPSFQIIDEGRELAPPVDMTITAAHGADEPEIIPAPRFVQTSRSISVMVPGNPPEGGSIAAISDPARQARQFSPMVIRGGLVGEASPAATPSTQPDEPAQAEAGSSPARTSPQPAARRAPADASDGGSGQRRPAPSPSSPPPPVYNAPQPGSTAVPQ